MKNILNYLRQLFATQALYRKLLVEFKELHQQYAALVLEKQDWEREQFRLQGKIGQLIADTRNAVQEISSLAAQKLALEGNYVGLQLQLQQKDQEISSLEAQRQTLKDSLESLQIQLQQKDLLVSSLNAEVNNLREQAIVLGSSLNQVRDEVTRLEKITSVLARDKTTLESKLQDVLYYKVAPPSSKTILAHNLFWVSWEDDPLYKYTWFAKLRTHKQNFEVGEFGAERIDVKFWYEVRPKQIGCPKSEWERFFQSIQWQDATADGSVWDSDSRFMLVYGLTRQPSWGDLCVFSCTGYSKLAWNTTYNMPGHPWLLVADDQGQLWRYDASTREFGAWEDERYIETSVDQM